MRWVGRRGADVAPDRPGLDSQLPRRARRSRLFPGSDRGAFCGGFGEEEKEGEPGIEGLDRRGPVSFGTVGALSEGAARGLRGVP